LEKPYSPTKTQHSDNQEQIRPRPLGGGGLGGGAVEVVQHGPRRPPVADQEHPHRVCGREGGDALGWNVAARATEKEGRF